MSPIQQIEPSNSQSHASNARSAPFLDRVNLYLPWLLLLFVAVIIAFRLLPDEQHFNGDEMRHAMNGVFIRDLLVDIPLSDPVRYAKEYYAKYPALAILHWPPFYYFVEGIFFLVFGISVLASRMATLAFALVGVYYWYRIAERQGPRRLALLSALIFPLLPYVLLYERSTMLEIPMISMCLGAIFYWQRFLEEERRADIWLVALFSAAALLTSQKAVFLAFFFGLHFLMSRRFRLLLRWDVWAAMGLSAALVLPWYLFTFEQLSMSYERAMGPGIQYVTQTRSLLFYFQKMPDQLGPVIFLLALFGVFWSLLRQPSRHAFLLIWVFSCYICYTLIGEKDQRHSMVWIPPLVYFALLAIETLTVRRRWAIVASAALVAYVLVEAYRFDRPRITGVEAAVQEVLALPDSDIVYYQGYYNGNFIFFVRKYDPERRHLVARAKQVVATRIMPGYGIRVIIEEQQELLDFFRTWGIRYAFVENRDLGEGLSLVRQVLHTDDFELVRVFPIWSNHPEIKDHKLYLYRYRGELTRSLGGVTVPMMTIREDIHVDLNRLAGRPWPN